MELAALYISAKPNLIFCTIAIKYQVQVFVSSISAEDPCSSESRPNMFATRYGVADPLSQCPPGLKGKIKAAKAKTSCYQSLHPRAWMEDISVRKPDNLHRR